MRIEAIFGRSCCRSAAWLLTALLLVFMGVPGSSRAQASADNEVTPEVQALYSQAKAAQARGDVTTATQKYQAILKRAPHLAAAYNNLGMLYFNQSDYPQAAAVLERGLKLNPHMITASAMLGLSYFEMGESDKAEGPLEVATRANPEDDNVQMALAHVLINLSKYQEATVPLRSILDRNPKDQQAWYLLGKTYLQLSEDSLGRINQIDPNSVVAHEVAGEIDESMHNYDGAMVEYKKAVDLAPKQTGTHLHLANVYWAISKWDSARDEFGAELANDPNSCIAHWKFADSTLEANGSADEALTHLNKAVERCPSLMQARVDRAKALIRLNKQVEALPDLLMAEKDSPNEPSIHFLLSQVYRAQGNTTEVQQEIRTYARLKREASESVAQQASDAIAIKSAAH